jgi:hypothetical protein
MKFILVVTDAHGKNLAFVSRELQTLSLKEATEAVRRGDVPGAYVVERKTGAYIRTKASVPKLEQFEKIAIPFKNLLLYAQGVRSAKDSPALKTYVSLFTSSLPPDQPFITLAGQPPWKVLTADVKRKVIPQRANILDSADRFKIDPYLLGAILIDEIAQLNPFEDILDALGVKIIGSNTSVGIAQIKTDTANSIIAKGLYNPNPDDLALPFKKLDKTAREHLYTYLIDPRHCIFFAGAYIRSIIDYWTSNVDLAKRSDIVGTLYSQGYGKPKPNPETNERGVQIATEFYSLAKQWLTEP